MRMFIVAVSDRLPDATREALNLAFQTDFKVATELMRESRHGPILLKSAAAYPFAGTLRARTTHDLRQAVPRRGIGIYIHFSRRTDPYPSGNARHQKQRIIDKFSSVLRNTEKQMLPKVWINPYRPVCLDPGLPWTSVGRPRGRQTKGSFTSR